MQPITETLDALTIELLRRNNEQLRAELDRAHHQLRAQRREIEELEAQLADFRRAAREVPLQWQSLMLHRMCLVTNADEG